MNVIQTNRRTIRLRMLLIGGISLAVLVLLLSFQSAKAASATASDDLSQIDSMVQPFVLTDHTLSIPTHRTKNAQVAIGSKMGVTFHAVQLKNRSGNMVTYQFADNKIETNDTDELTDDDVKQMSQHIDDEYGKTLTGPLLTKRRQVVKDNLTIGRITHTLTEGAGFESIHIDSQTVSGNIATVVATIKGQYITLIQKHDDGSFGFARPWGDYQYTFSYQKVNGKWLIADITWVQTGGIRP